MKIALASFLSAAVLLSITSEANAICFPIRPSAESTVVDNENGTFRYSVTATGQGCVPGQPDLNIRDFYLPFFADMGITNIRFANDAISQFWTFSIEPGNDLFGLGGGVLHFQSTNTVIGGTFIFEALYAGVKGPFEHTLYNSRTGEYTQFRGDPLIPASPLTVAALAAVPEANNVAMMMAGLATLLALGVKRRGPGARR